MNHTVVTVGITAVLGALYCWTGRVNSLFFFGRTVRAGFGESAAGRAITRGYVRSIVAVTVGVAAMTCLLCRPWSRGAPSHLGGVGVLVEMAACLFVFSRTNRQVRETAGSAPEPQSAVTEVNLLAQPTYWVPGLTAMLLPPVLAGFGCALAEARMGSDMGVGARTQALLDMLERHGSDLLFGMGMGMLAAACGLLLMFRYSARLRTRMAQYTVRAMFSLEWIGTALIVGLLLASAAGVTLSKLESNAVLAVTLAGTVGLMLWNQSRAKKFVPPPVEMGADDRWRWGLFYVDRNDPALFVQSRCGAGYGLNYGRVLAWPISLALVLYLVTVMFVLPFRH